MTALELHRRLHTIRALLSVAGQRADDLCTHRENLEAPRTGVDLLLRDVTWGSAT